MKIAIVIPAYNEEEFLPITLQSLIDQTITIDTIMVVNDGSVDGTEMVCKTYSGSYDNVSYVTNLKKEKRASGSKVVRAFNLGLKQIDLNRYDLIAKIDSDIGFPSDYFETVINAFTEDNSLGMYGGICTIQKEGKWINEVVSNLDHVRGALKVYRVSAFQQMQGLRTIMGWDSIDEFLLRFYNWKVVCNPDIKVKHYRVTHSINGWYKESILNGEVFSNLGYNFIVALISSAKRGFQKQPYLITAVVSFVSYIINKLSGSTVSLSKEQRVFINRYRIRSIFSRLNR